MLNSPAAEPPLDRLVALEIAGLVLLPKCGPRVYYRAVGTAFSREALVTGTLVALEGPATLEFSLAAGTVDYLRFDLPAVAG